ncbi:hypothetical protein AB8881_00735 [Alphaproteobacteria bacterium LSUCC0396]
MSSANVKINPFKDVEGDLAKVIGLYSKRELSTEAQIFFASLLYAKVRSHISKPPPGIVVKGKQRDAQIDKLEAAVKKLKIAIENLDPTARSYFSTTFRVNENEKNEIWPNELLDSWVLEISKFRAATSALPRSGASPVGLALARACFQTFTEHMKMPPTKGISSGTKFAQFGQDCASVLFADELDFVSAARQYYDLRNQGALK